MCSPSPTPTPTFRMMVLKELNRFTNSAKFFSSVLKGITERYARKCAGIGRNSENTENFLKESGEKLSREDKAVIEQKLGTAFKMKCEQLTVKAKQSKKELDKVGTTAIREETEKVLIQMCVPASALHENDEALQGLYVLPAVRRSKR